MKLILKIAVLIGIFILPLINSRITELLWFSFSMPVNWNFEFTKVVFFNIWSSVVIALFFVSLIINKQRVKIFCLQTNMTLYFFYLILVLSTYFSTSPYISFFWNEVKSHSFIMWSNLIGLFIVFSSLIQTPPKLPQAERDNTFLKQIISTFIFSWIFVSTIWLKEYFYPTFDYWDLWNRLFSTFWHPNYVSIFLVSLMPFLYSKTLTLTNPLFNFLPKGEKIAQFSIIILFVTALLFTKSVFAIFLFIAFNIWYIYSISPFCKGSTRKGRGSFIKYSVALWVILLSSFLLLNFFPEKLHSFVSRYFIWETSLKIIFSDIKILLLWWWAETFVYFFDNFKSEYLYIFENLWFSADRPHNLILNFFYHFWVWWLAVIIVLYYKIFSNKISGWTQRFSPTGVSLILIFLFLLLNPTSIVIYLLIVILLANVLPLALVKSKDSGKRYYWLTSLFLTIITLVSLYWAYSSYHFYYSETKVSNNQFAQAKNIYTYNPNNFFYSWDFDNWFRISKIKTPEYYYTKIQLSDNKIELCWEYISQYHFAESYFFCWNMFWNSWDIYLAKSFYNSWLELLPDLWNKNSHYYNNFLVKNLKINWNRFLSKKYGLAQILKRVWIINK